MVSVNQKTKAPAAMWGLSFTPLKPILPSIIFDVEAAGATEHSFAAKTHWVLEVSEFGPSHGK
jgi:hypothetical protein